MLSRKTDVISRTIQDLDDCLTINAEYISGLTSFVDEAQKYLKRERELDGDVPLNHHAMQKSAFASKYLSQLELRPEWSEEESRTLSTSLSRLYPRESPHADEIDWEKVVELCMHFDKKFQRDGISCKIHFVHFFNNRPDWTSAEDLRLSDLVSLSNGTDWEWIANQLDNRSPFECFARCYSELNPILVPCDFSKQDDENLTEFVAQMGDSAWTSVAVSMGTGHTETQLANRWHKTLKPGISSGRWNPVLDKRLLAAVAIYGPGKWALIAKHVPGKTDRKCRERYMEQLAPGLKPQGEWDQEEDRILLDSVNKHGMGNWALIKQDLPGRTDQMCRVRFMRIASDEDKKRYAVSVEAKRETRSARTRKTG